MIWRVLRALGAILALALLSGCGNSERVAAQRSSRSTAAVAWLTAARNATQPSRLRLGADSGTETLFAENCSRGATRCEITFENGAHFRCTGHQAVVVGEGPPTYVEHGSCTPVPAAIQLTSRRSVVPSCSGRTVRLSPGPVRESEMTQEGSNSFILTNISHAPCAIDGYPRVRLSYDDRLLPFTQIDGDGFYVSARRPRPLLLTPGAQAYFKLAKVVCQVSVGARPTRILVSLPGGGTVGMPMSSEDRLAYCAGARPDGHIGDRLSLSPVVAIPYETAVQLPAAGVNDTASSLSCPRGRGRLLSESNRARSCSPAYGTAPRRAR